MLSAPPVTWQQAMSSQLSALSSHIPVLAPHRGHHSPPQNSGSQCALHRVRCPHAPAQGGASARTSQRAPGDLPQWVSEGLQAPTKGTCSVPGPQQRQGPPAEAFGQARPPGVRGLQSWGPPTLPTQSPRAASSRTKEPPTPTPTCLNCHLVASCVKEPLQARKRGAEWGARSFRGLALPRPSPAQRPRALCQPAQGQVWAGGLLVGPPGRAWAGHGEWAQRQPGSSYGMALEEGAGPKPGRVCPGRGDASRDRASSLPLPSHGTSRNGPDATQPGLPRAGGGGIWAQGSGRRHPHPSHCRPQFPFCTTRSVLPRMVRVVSRGYPRAPCPSL